MENCDKYVYEIEMRVRDYELDSEGIVNNANYLHYLEHARHSFCEDKGLSFAAMQRKGIVPVLNKIEVEYKSPLRSGDRFVCGLWMERRGARFVFHQDIFKADGTMVVTAVVSCVCIENGRLDRGDLLAEIFSDYLA